MSIERVGVVGAGQMGGGIAEVCAKAGADVLGVSLVTNLAAGMTGQPLSHDEVVAAGRQSATRMGSLLASVIARL